MRAFNFLARAQSWLAMAAATVIVVTTTADVILRYAFGRPIHGAYDVVECMLVPFVFHGVAVVFLRRDNITIDLVDHIVSRGLKRFFIRTADLISLAALVLMALAMISPALQAYEYGDRKLELGLLLWVVWVFALTGIFGTILCAAGTMLRGPDDDRAGETH